VGLWVKGLEIRVHQMIADDVNALRTGLGFGVWGLGFGVWGLGFGVVGCGCRIEDLGFRVYEMIADHVRPCAQVKMRA
jgi:hypothetical protein